MGIFKPNSGVDSNLGGSTFQGVKQVALPEFEVVIVSGDTSGSASCCFTDDSICTSISTTCISADSGNVLTQGTDGKLYAAPSGGGGGVTLYTGNGSIPASTTRTVTLSSGADLVITGGFGTSFQVDGDTGKVTIPGVLDPIAIQYAGVQIDASMPNESTFITDGSTSGFPSGTLVYKDSIAEYNSLEGGNNLIGPSGYQITFPQGTPGASGQILQATDTSGTLEWVAGGGSGNSINSWAATTSYDADDLVITPGGALVKRNTTGTSTGTYDATEAADWTLIAPNVDDNNAWTPSTYYYGGQETSLQVLPGRPNIFRSISGVSQGSWNSVERLFWTAKSQSILHIGYTSNGEYPAKYIISEENSLWQRPNGGTGGATFDLSEKANWVKLVENKSPVDKKASGSVVLTSGDINKFIVVDSTGSNVLNLPNMTSVEQDCFIDVYNSGSNSMTVVPHGSDTLIGSTFLSANAGATFKIIDTNQLVAIGTGIKVTGPYTESFVVGDWSVVGSGATYSVLQNTHEKGSGAHIVQVYDSGGELTTVSTTVNKASGDVTLTVASGSEFAGDILIN